ncbi:MAG TPA: hypothetical protein VH951_11595 [Dehalococcoidia bacterium]
MTAIAGQIPGWLRQTAEVKAFVSYCTAFDDGLLMSLEDQARGSLRLTSSSEPFAGSERQWEAETRVRMAAADVVVALVGTLVDAQMRDECAMARSLGKTVVALVDEADDLRARRVLPDAVVLWTRQDFGAELQRTLGA